MISVCMATYNGEKYIKEQVDSILCQLGADDELIVSDDGSKDQTIAIVKSYNDSRIKVLHNTNKRGPIGNFENAIKSAKGNFIFLADQDDVWYPNKVSICMTELSKVDLVLHDAVVVDSELNPLINSFFELRGSKKGYFNNLKRNSFVGCCMAFRASVLKYTLPFPDKIAMHDMWIALMTMKRGQVELIREPLIYYRRHGNNASPTAEKSNLSFLTQLKYRIQMFLCTQK